MNEDAGSDVHAGQSAAGAVATKLKAVEVPKVILPGAVQLLLVSSKEEQRAGVGAAGQIDAAVDGGAASRDPQAVVMELE